MRVADALVDILQTEGVKFVSTLPGDDILPIFDALHENGQVPLILTRHEQATVYIADGYARSTGEVGVAMVTKGPAAVMHLLRSSMHLPIVCRWW